MSNKIILKIKAGSHLYGTNTPNSDKDYLGIYLNTKEELLGLQTSEELTQNIESKSENGRNTKNAVDCKFYELRKFCKLALKCNPTILEILFVNPENIIEITHEGKELLSLKKEFLSKHLINSFMGYAFSQKKKAFIKSENLQKIIDAYEKINLFLNDHTIYLYMTYKCISKNSHSNIPALNQYIEEFKNERDAEMIKVGDLIFPIDISIKKLREALKIRLDKVSWRKDNILQYGLDYKFMSHSVRLLLEGMEIIKTNNLILPLQYKELIKSIKLGKIENDKIIELMDKYEDEFHLLKENNLPDNGNYKKINDFIISTYNDLLICDFINTIHI